MPSFSLSHPLSLTNFLNGLETWVELTKELVACRKERDRQKLDCLSSRHKKLRETNWLWDIYPTKLRSSDFQFSKSNLPWKSPWELRDVARCCWCFTVICKTIIMSDTDKSVWNYHSIMLVISDNHDLIWKKRGKGGNSNGTLLLGKTVSLVELLQIKSKQQALTPVLNPVKHTHFFDRLFVFWV